MPHDMLIALIPLTIVMFLMGLNVVETIIALLVFIVGMSVS